MITGAGFKKALGFILAALFVLIHASAEAGERATGKGRTLSNLQLTLPSLEKPLSLSLYLPPGFCDAGMRYPALYLLHGYGGSHRSWLKGGKVAATLDRMIMDGAIPPLVVVMPDAGNSWYVNAASIGGAGNYEDALLRELPNKLEHNLPLHSQREGRALAGLSMGGYGALRFAYEKPDHFAAVAALSPAVFPDLGRGDVLSDLQIRLFKGAFGTPFSAERFNAHNVFAPLDKLAGLEAPPATYLSVGDDDWLGLYEGTFALFRTLKAHKLPVELRVVDGNHNWKLWAREIVPALRFLGDHLKRPEIAPIQSVYGAACIPAAWQAAVP